MADTKISALPVASLPLAGTEVLPIVQGGITEQVAVNDLTVRNVRANATTGILRVAGPAAGTTRIMTVPNANFTVARTDAAQSFTGNQTLSTGNLVIGTSGQGIDFSATPGTGTSELLADYEEGDFTPAITASSGTITSFTLGTCNYTKVGRMVAVNFSVTITDAGTASGSLDVPLPFTNGAAIANGSGRENALTGVQLQSRVTATGTSMNIQTYANTTAIATNAQIRASMTYFV